MDLSKQSITAHDFELNRRGYDPDAVDARLAEIADAVAEQTRKFNELEATVAGLQAKVRDADESEEALRLTLKAAAHAKEELLSNAREQASTMEAEAATKAEAVVNEADAKAKFLLAEAETAAAERTDAAATHAKNLEAGARLQAGEVAKAALAESEALVSRIEDLRARLEGAESALNALHSEANPGLEAARAAVESALEKAREAAENPDILAALVPAAAVPVAQPAVEVVSAPESLEQGEPAAHTEHPQPDQDSLPSQDSGSGEPWPASPAEDDEPVAAESSEVSVEAGGEAGQHDAADPVEPVTEPESVTPTPAPPEERPADADDAPAPAEATSHEATDGPHLEIVEPAESAADISDKVDRLLEELREVT